MVAHILVPATGKAEAGRSLAFKANLVHTVSNRTARVTQRNAVSKISF